MWIKSQTQNQKQNKYVVVGSNMTEQDQIDRPSWKKMSFIEKRGTYRKGVDLFFVEGVTVVTTGHDKIKTSKQRRIQESSNCCVVKGRKEIWKLGSKNEEVTNFESSYVRQQQNGCKQIKQWEQFYLFIFGV